MDKKNVPKNTSETPHEPLPTDHPINTTVPTVPTKPNTTDKPEKPDTHVDHAPKLFCSQCGNKLKQGYKFCSHCGAKI